jgi:ATP-dependent DNA helicase RecG
VPNILTTLRVKIELIDTRRSWHRKMLLTESLVSDETGKIKIIWFNQRYVGKILNLGDEIYLSGKPILTEHGLEFHSPSFEKIGKFEKATVHTNRLVPIYPTTEKLSQKQIRFILTKALPLATQIQDWLPSWIKNQEKLFALPQAIHQIHFPISKENLAQARRRLKFDEIFLLQLRNGLIKKELLKFKSQPIKFQESASKKFVAQLPFKLTLAQKKSAWEIIQDLGKNKPMNRLLEGDVGSGKTITAGLAILNVLLNKCEECRKRLNQDENK